MPAATPFILFPLCVLAAPWPLQHESPRTLVPSVAHQADADDASKSPDPFAMPAIGDLLQPDFSRRDFSTFVAQLTLDENQQPLLSALLDDYQAAFAEGAQSVQRAFSELRPAVDRNRDRENRDRRAADIDDEMKEIADDMDHLRDRMSDNPDTREEDQAELANLQKRLARLQADRAAVYSPQTLTPEQFQAAVADASQSLSLWQSRRADLRTRFIADVQAILSESQKPLWPPLERKFTREKTLARGVLQGESINLFALLAELQIPIDSLASDLQAYDLSLDSALTQRNQFLDSSRTDLWRAFQARDLDNALAIDSRESALRTAVRNVNDDFAAGLASKLSPDHAETLTSAYHSRAYPRVFRTSPAHRIIKAALEIPDLDPVALDAIKAIHDSFLQELSPSNARLLELTRISEPHESAARISARITPDADLDPDPDIQSTRNLIEERSDLGRRYLNQLKSILTPEQYEQLPGAVQLNGHARPRTSRQGPGETRQFPNPNAPADPDD